MNEPELKPCPFCGGKAIIKRDKTGIYSAQCSICKCMTTFQFDFGYGEEESMRKAVAVWNRRVAD